MSYAPRHAQPKTARRAGRTLTGLTVCTPVLAAGIAFGSPALAATTTTATTPVTTTATTTTATTPVATPAPAKVTQHNPTGYLRPATRTGHHTVKIVGHTRDRDVNTSIPVTISVDHVARKVVMADILRPSTGRHTVFRTSIHIGSGEHKICAYAHNRGPGHSRRIGCFTVAADVSGKNAAIARLAARYVGARYVYGGASPSGFDCSGLVKYVYRRAAHIDVAHSAETQMQRSHHISRARAKAGDLVFFYSGSYVYHVGIYAGHNRMWAAATPADGVRHQDIWSSDVSFGSYTHR